MKSIIKVALLILLPFSIIMPQYSNADSILIKTTYTREFNQAIIDKYLNSPDSRKVKAGLLSVAQSEDTLRVPQIIKLNFSKYGKEICFALGELGPCSQSSDFLIEKIKDKKISSAFNHEAFNAIGKTGDHYSFNQIIDYSNNLKIKKSAGISLAMYGYYTRAIASKSEVTPVLAKEFKMHPEPSEENFEAAFALYRTSAPDSLRNFLIEELKSFISIKNINNYYAATAAPYILGCLRKHSYFPDDYNLFNQLLSSRNYAIKVEATHTLINYKFKNTKELDKYLRLLDDENHNVGRSAAASLKDIKLSSELKSYLKSVLVKILNRRNLDAVNQDELFLSYLKLFPDSFENQQKCFETLVTNNCFYDACGEFDSSGTALNFLLDSYNKESNKNKINVLQSLLNFQTKFCKNKRLAEIIVGAINSDFPPFISIASDGIDSSLIIKMLDTLKVIIPAQISRYMSNPDFQESITSLTDLSKKVNTELYTSVLNILSRSEDYSIKKFSLKLLRKSILKLGKDSKYFSELWQNAFKYKNAEITTDKGTFIIELLPQFAPITAGNFSYLASKNFFKSNPFHRVVPSFVIQGGDPEETGWGGPGYDIVSEFSPLNYEAGMVGMASAGKDTEGSQWFVTTGNYPHLNGRYTIFGKAIKGLNIINRIEQDDKIIRIKLI